MFGAVTNCLFSQLLQSLRMLLYRLNSLLQEAKVQSEHHKAEIRLLQDRLHLESDETFKRKKLFHMVSFNTT